MLYFWNIIKHYNRLFKCETWVSSNALSVILSFYFKSNIDNSKLILFFCTWTFISLSLAYSYTLWKLPCSYLPLIYSIRHSDWMLNDDIGWKNKGKEKKLPHALRGWVRERERVLDSHAIDSLIRLTFFNWITIKQFYLNFAVQWYLSTMTTICVAMTLSMIPTPLNTTQNCYCCY